MIQEIKFNGYSATPSDYDCLDGDLATSMEMIPKEGSMRPIALGAPIRMLYKMRVIRVHQTSAYKHYITINEDNTEIGWIDGEGEFDGTYTTTATKIADVTGFVSVNSVGNTLIIVTKNAIIYSLWKDDGYVLLGDHIPNIDVSFGLVGHPRLFSVSDGSKSKFDVIFEVPSVNPSSTIPTEDGVKQLTSQVMAKVNKFVREQTIDKGRFCFPFLVRYALRLYDGTSLVGHSAPILMNPSTTAAPIVFYSNIVSQGADSNGKYSVKTTCDIMLMAADLDYAVVHTADSEQLSNWKDIVKSVDVYISKPIYTYDQNGEIGSLYDADNFGTKFIGRMEAKGSTVSESQIPQEDEMTLVFAADGTSIAPVLQTSYGEWTYEQIYQLYFSRTVPSNTLHLPEFDAKDVNDSIVNTGSFFKLCSIPIEDIEIESRKTIEIADSYLNSLVAREAMTDDYLSHDQLTATNTMVYNQRLHLSGVRRKLFSGFPAQSMFAYKNCDIYIEDGVDYELASGTLVIFPIIDRVPYRITTYIKEDNHTYSVESIDSSQSDIFLSASLANEDSSHGRYFFYPNMNAVKMVVKMEGYVGGKVIDLQPHPYLNGAFAFVDYRLPNTIGTPPDIEVSGGNTVPQLNKLYVSEVNNPFYFPLLGIYTIGIGEIYNISSATKALSEGQFGQFPLYAFTSDGVWALQISSTGTYSAVQPITRDVCTNPNGVTQIDSAVLFTTERGIMLLSGSQSICISDILDSDDPFKLTSLDQGEAIIDKLGLFNVEAFNTLPFRSFLKECGMIYDYTHQSVIVFNPNCAYAYVYSFESKAWGMMLSSIASSVNSYPEALAMSHSGVLLDYTADAPGVRIPYALLVTRPLKLGSPDILKTIDTIIVRGNFAKGDVCGLVLYGSRDLRNWFMVFSSKDHYLRGFKGTPYKYYRVAILMRALNSAGAEGVGITGCTIQYTPKLINQPR